MLYSSTEYSRVLKSRAITSEILRVAREMYEKQHAEIVKKLEAAPISKKTRNKILRSLNAKTR